MDKLTGRSTGSRADFLPRIMIPRHSRTFVPERVRQAAQIFLETEAASGLVLLLAASIALAWVNSPLGDSYEDLWSTLLTFDLGLFVVEEDLRHVVNDGFMTIFFFVVGLEIKRELVHGELSGLRKALLPGAAALGGMLLPAAIYLAFNAGQEAEDGWGIPMATDIAFAVGVMSLVGRRIPFGLKIFLLALAIVDDIGAILVIALFYTSELALDNLAIAVALFGLIFAMNNRGVRDVYIYVVVGALMWVAMLKSGVHPTITGVVLGLMTPALPFFDKAGFAGTMRQLVAHFEAAVESGSENDQENLLEQIEDLTRGSEATLDSLEKALHPWVSFVVMPVFALANAGVELSADGISGAASSAVTQGIVLGLILGKFVGIIAFAWLATILKLGSLPAGANWRQMAGLALVAGIGFTVSLFITDLALETEEQIMHAKVGILFASLSTGLLGYLVLRTVSGRGPASEEPPA